MYRGIWKKIGILFLLCICACATHTYATTCPVNTLAVEKNGADYVCEDAAKILTPQRIASDQVIQVVCGWLQNVHVDEGAGIAASNYKVTIKNNSGVLFSWDWKSITHVDDISVGDAWVSLENYVPGDYLAECELQYQGTPNTYTVSQTFEISNPLGTSCDSLTIANNNIAKGASSQISCSVRNTTDGSRSIITQKDQEGDKCLGKFFSYGTIHSPAKNISDTDCALGWSFQTSLPTPVSNPSSALINTTNTISGYTQNGIYNTYCVAHGKAIYKGFTTQQIAQFPYAWVTSTACGFNQNKKIHVGTSYCSQISIPNNVHAGQSFDLVCGIDTSEWQPTNYAIIVDGNPVLNGSIASGATTITETISLSAWDHSVGCLITGAENADYISPSCQATIIPNNPTAGNCLSGDNTLNATLCTADDSGTGSNVSEKLVHVCSASRKCEYTCNTGYTPFNGTCIEKANYGDITVPSHIRPQEDYPLVMCQGDPDDRYFKYQISRFQGTTTVSTCPALASGNYPNCVCQAGYTYNSDNNSCVADISCPAGSSGTYPNCVCGGTTPAPTQPSGPTTGQNIPGLANICDNELISQGACSSIPGVVPIADAPGGNKKFRLPKEASGAQYDYELVQIGNQCWFAENAREGTGSYYGGASSEPSDGEGKLYTFDEVMAGNPGSRNQGVCPAGWHVPSDCEFMALENTLGLSTTEQAQSNVNHNSFGPIVIDGGSSGFDMKPTGYWDPTGGGWIARGNNGGQGQLHISANAPGVTGHTMKRYGYVSGRYQRYQGAGNSYRMGVRCLYDGDAVTSGQTDLSSISNTCTSTRISDTEIKTVCTYTGSDQTVQPPSGATSALVKVWGAGGGSQNSIVNAGAGGYVSGTLTPTNISNMRIVVGGGGEGTPNPLSHPASYGFGGAGTYRDGSGGGLSGLFTGSTPVGSGDMARAVMIAGGGWGAADQQGSAGGAGGDSDAGGESTMQWKNDHGGDSVTWAAGGWGYNGGTSNATKTRGGTNYGGSISLAGTLTEAPKQNDPDYISGVGLGGGHASLLDSSNPAYGTDWGDGLVVIRWQIVPSGGSWGQWGQQVYDPATNTCSAPLVCPAGNTGTAPVQPIPGAETLSNTCHGKKISVGGCNGQTSITWQGETYRLIEIGGQCWTENMRHDADVGVSVYHPNNRTNTVEAEGKVYNKTAARNGDTTTDERVQGLCPAGYHLPSDCEFMALEAALGMSATDQTKTYYETRTLTAQTLVDNNWGFTFPGSYCNTNGWCGARGQVERYLTSTGAMGRYYGVDDPENTFNRGWNETQTYYYKSVRCIADGVEIDGSDFDAYADGQTVTGTGGATAQNTNNTPSRTSYPIVEARNSHFLSWFGSGGDGYPTWSSATPYSAQILAELQDGINTNGIIQNERNYECYMFDLGEQKEVNGLRLAHNPNACNGFSNACSSGGMVWWGYSNTGSNWTVAPVSVYDDEYPGFLYFGAYGEPDFNKEDIIQPLTSSVNARYWTMCTNWGSIVNDYISDVEIYLQPEEPTTPPTTGGGGTYPNCSCPAGQAYDLASNTCQGLACSCPAGETYNPATHTCESPIPQVNIPQTCDANIISMGGCGGRTSIEWEGETYRLIEIGGQCWTENMNHETDVGSYAWLNNAPSEPNPGDGRVYNSVATANGDDTTNERYQGMCPDGFHIPSECEFRTLKEQMGNTFRASMDDPNGWDEHFVGGWFATNVWNNYGSWTGSQYNTSSGLRTIGFQNDSSTTFDRFTDGNRSRYKWSVRCIADGTEYTGQELRTGSSETTTGGGTNGTASFGFGTNGTSALYPSRIRLHSGPDMTGTELMYYQHNQASFTTIQNYINSQLSQGSVEVTGNGASGIQIKFIDAKINGVAPVSVNWAYQYTAQTVNLNVAPSGSGGAATGSAPSCACPNGKIYDPVNKTCTGQNTGPQPTCGCPAGETYDSASNTCKGSSPAVASVCSSSPISQGGCGSIPGVTPIADAPGGNKKYLLPKSASGAEHDYELVEIGNQCWFAQNAREGTGSYYGAGGISDARYQHSSIPHSEEEGKLYTYNEVMAGNPGVRNQGICPAGWHVPSDCEFMALESALGLSTSEQVQTGVHNGVFGPIVLDGGSSGFDIKLTGYWDPTGGGWIYRWTFGRLRTSGNAPSISGRAMERGIFQDKYYRNNVIGDSYRVGVRCLYDGTTVTGDDLTAGTTTSNPPTCSCPSGWTYDATSGSCVEAPTGPQPTCGCPAGETYDAASNTCTTTQTIAELPAVCDNKDISLSSCSDTSVSWEGNNYRTFNLGGQCWTENMDHPADAGAYQYYPVAASDRDPNEGLQYNITAARNGDSSGAERIQGVCPAGYHLPSDCEFMALEAALGMSASELSVLNAHTPRTIDNASIWNDPNSVWGSTFSGAYYNTNGWLGRNTYERYNTSTGNITRAIFSDRNQMQRWVYGESYYRQNVRCIADGTTVKGADFSTTTTVPTGNTPTCSCPSGWTYDATSGSCVEAPTGPQPTCGCPAGETYDAASNTCTTTQTIAELPAVCDNKDISLSSCSDTSVSWEGEDYRTFNFGGQCWTENMRHPSPVGATVYYGGASTEKNPGSGYLYNLAAARNGQTGERVQGICPSGYHIPSDCEWMAMEATLGMSTAALESEWYTRDTRQISNTAISLGDPSTIWWQTRGWGWFNTNGWISAGGLERYYTSTDPRTRAVYEDYPQYIQRWWYGRNYYRSSVRCIADGTTVKGADFSTTTTVPTGNTPSCSCPSGWTYDATSGSCVSWNTIACPLDATGVYPNCVCNNNSQYIPETNSCGYTSIVVTDVIYTSPVYEMDENGYGAKIHTAGLPDLGEYAVSCLSAPTMDGAAGTPFIISPHIDDVGIINSVYGAPHIDRIDRYRDVDGNGTKELDDVDGIAAAIDSNGNLVGNPIGIDYICSAIDGTPMLVGGASDLFQSIYNWPESVVSPVFYGGSVLPPLTTYISSIQSASAYKRGVHETACFVKSGPGYSTNAQGIDEFCLSETGNCAPSTCVSSANVCCADNPADQPVFNDPACNNDPYAPGCQMVACCRLTPDAPGCFGCAAGERYCPDSAQCINPDAGETCPGDDTDGGPGGSCNANGICEVGESCNCSDCGGQQDTCEDGLRCRYDPTDQTNSVCMGCREGTRWCESQNSCIPAGQACNGGEVCNNDGVCSGVESCGCADCSNQQDHCADGLKCLYDADDPINSSCGGGCPVGTRWCSADNKCIPAGQTCNGGEVCNNDGICNADEGCGCGDCSAQNDHCAAGLTCAFDAVNPEQSSCQGGPRTLVSSEMRRELCSAEESRALLQCADDDCEYFQIGDEVFSADGINFYGTSDTAPFFEAFPEGPVVLGGAMSFGSVKLSGTGPLVPMFIKSPSGVISQRYIYWNTKDTIKPTSNGLKLHLSNGAQVSPTNPAWSNLPVIASVDCEDDMNGQDTPFCGCDVDEESGFETQFIDGDDNRALYTKIISANEEVKITVRDTAGNVAGTYSADIDFIDLDAPTIEITDSNGVDIAEIDRQNTSGIPLKITLFDEVSGIQDYSIKIGDPSLVLNAIDFDTCADALAPISANQIGTHGKSKVINGGTVSTGKAIFVCVQDAAGNITQKKFTFSGSRLIGYYQGPVLGFGYSGETGITSVEKYEERLVERVQEREVELNKSYITQQSNLAICQENAIERNIDTLARGRLQPNTGDLVIDDLTSNAFVSNINGTNAKNTDGIIYYSFDTTGANVDGNTGRVVELQGKSVIYTGWNDPTSGPYSEESTFSMDSVEVDGYKTVIIEGGNLYIGADMYYADEDSMIVFVVKRGIPSIHGHRQGGNVYIDSDVTNVNGLFFIDGALMNVDKSNTGSFEVLSSYNDTDVEKLRRQLLIYGSLSSNNTRGGSLKTAISDSNRISHSLPDYLEKEGHCPLGTDAYNSMWGGFENCDIKDAAKYDLETFRTFNLTRSNGSYLLDAASTPLCAGIACSCAGNGSAFTAVGGIGTSSVVPNYFNSTTYALSGKRKCFYEDGLGNDKFETTNQLYATYVKFDSRDDKFDFDVLGGTDCR